MGNSATHLRPEAVSDLENATEFSADEIRDYYKRFMGKTAHGQMELTHDEFVDAYVKLFPKGDAKRFAEHVFRLYDKNESGSIDFREFLVNLSIQLKGNLQDKLEWTFNLYDIDGTGSITRDELVEMVKSIHGLKGGALPSEKRVSAQELADYIMKRADNDHDNALSKHEFVEGAMSSTTIQRMILGSLQASSSPFTKRRQKPKVEASPNP